MPFTKRTIHWRNAADQTFCGRDEVIKDIDHGLDRSDSFAVIGQRGMGKSMLLRKIRDQRETRPGFDPICLIVQFSGLETSAFVLVEMVRDWLAAALAHGSEKDEQGVRNAIGAGVGPTTDKPILRMIQAAESLMDQPVSLELFLDDVHRLCEQPWAEDLLANLEHELFSHRLHARHLRTIFCGDIRMKNLLERLPVSDLWQQLRNVWLQPLGDDEVAELLGNIELPPSLGASKAIAALLGSWAGGHPSLTQYLLRDLLENPTRDPTKVLENSASRFLAELAKMLEASWSSLNEDAQSVIRKATVAGTPTPIRELAASLSMGASQCSKALQGALASGFVRLDGNSILPPGKVMARWLDLYSSQPAVLPHVHIREPHPAFPTIMHLTDLHFGGEGHAWDHPSEIPGVGRPPHDRVTLLGTLVQDLKSLRIENECLWPRVVVVSGDLLFQCDKEGIEQAVDFLGNLSAELGIERSCVVLCPGNHEQNQIIFTEEPKAQLASYTEIWNKFYPSGFRRLPLEWSPGGYTHVFRVENLEILSLNSCEDLDPVPNSNGSHPREQGYIGLQQLQVAGELLGREEPPTGCIRVAVLHHHLSQHRWTSGVDYSILREVGRVIEWLRRFHFDLVFHGHQHCVGFQTRVEDERYLTVLAGGSAGVASAYRWRGGMPLLYQLIYSGGPNQAVRVCQSLDLYTETWVSSQHEKPKSIPIGFLKQDR